MFVTLLGMWDSALSRDPRGLCLSDVNECDSSPCSQECANVYGSYQCYCRRGYQLSDVDGVTCEGEGTAPCTPSTSRPSRLEGGLCFSSEIHFCTPNPPLRMRFKKGQSHSPGFSLINTAVAVTICAGTLSRAWRWLVCAPGVGGASRATHIADLQPLALGKPSLAQARGFTPLTRLSEDEARWQLRSASYSVWHSQVLKQQLLRLLLFAREGCFSFTQL